MCSSQAGRPQLAQDLSVGRLQRGQSAGTAMAATSHSEAISLRQSAQRARSSPNVVDRSANALCLWMDSSASDLTPTPVVSGLLGERFRSLANPARPTA